LAGGAIDDDDEITAINVTPLVDVTLVLLIIFMVTTSLISNAEGLQALVAKPASANGWNGPYLKGGLPADPWGNPYHYANPGPNGGLEILSLGADNAPGGEGENVDVRNKQ
jgi:general secretion pathway protein G